MLSCESVTTALVTRSRYLGSLPVPTGYNASVSGLAADDRYVYATWSLSKASDGHDSPGPGELLVLDPDLLADPTGTADPVVARVTVGYQPRNIAVNRTTGIIYVVNYGQQGEHPYSLFAISADSYQVIARIPIGQVPIDVAVNEATNRVYVSDPYPDGRIHVIDGATHTIVAGIVVPSPNALAFDATTNTLYAVLNKQTGEDDQIDAVAVIACGADGTTHTVTKIVPVGPQRSRPWELALLAPPAGPGSGPHQLLVANMGALHSVPPNVTAFDLHDGSMKAHAPVPTAFGSPVGLAVNAAASQGYVATNAGFQVLDVLRGTIESPVTLGPFPISAVVDGVGRIHIGDATAGTLTTVLPLPAQGPIAEHLEEGVSLGAPLTGPLPVPGDDPRARYQIFELGVVVASTDYGAVTMSREIADGWQPSAGVLGVPTDGSVALVGEGGYEIAPFQRGQLVYRAPAAGRAGGTTIPVLGDIAVCYQLPDNFAALGLPVAAEESLPDGGLRQRFDKGEIYWRQDLGAHALWGPILFWWLQSGGVASQQRYPIGDVSRAGNSVWESCLFEDGTMYAIPGTETAWVVHGEIAKAYLGTFGGPSGDLGFPAGDEQSTATGGWYQDFEHGVLVWFPDGHQYAGAHAYRAAELRLSYFSIGGDQGPVEGNRDLFVRAVVERIDQPGGTAVSLMNRGFPYEDGDYGDPEHTFDPPYTVQLADVMRGAMEFQVMFASYDKDGGVLGGSEQTGTINHGLVHPPWDDAPYNWDPRPPYTVDNLWGFEDPADQSQYKFRVNYKVTEPAEPWDPSLQFRQQWWWRVNNFDTERIDMAQYARAYADVDPTARWLTLDKDELISNTFEAAFFHLFVKGIAKKGNCYGMSVEVLYAMRGRSIFTEPVYRYGTPNPVKGDHWGEPTPGEDDDLIDQFNVRHASQLGAPVIEWFLRLFGQGLTHNPIAVFENSRAAYANGEWPVLNFSRFWGNKAHTVLPIAWVRNGEGSPLPDDVYGEIYIADPFHEWGRDGRDDSDGKYKVIVYNDNRFEYDGKWAGGEWIDSRMYWIPWSRLNGVPHTPGLGILMEVAQSGLAIFGGDADIMQVTDSAGRRLFAAGLTGPPRSWNDLERDPALRIPGLLPVPQYGADDELPGPTLLHATGTDMSHTYHIAGAGGSYRWGLRTPAMSAVVMARASAVADLVTAERLGTADRAVSFSVPAGGANKTVSFILNGLPRADRGKQFVADALSVVPTQRVSAHLRDGGRELLIVNSGQQTNVRIRVRPEPDAALTAPKQVPLAAGKVTRLRPADWSDVVTSPLQVEVRDTVDGPPVECFEL